MQWEQDLIVAAARRDERQRLAAEQSAELEAHQQEMAQRREEWQRLAAERAALRLEKKQSGNNQGTVTPEQRQEQKLSVFEIDARHGSRLSRQETKGEERLV